MQTINYIKSTKSFSVLAFVIMISIGGCESMLDVEAEDTISGEILTDQANIENALNGAYYNLMGIYDGASGGQLLGGDFKLMATLLTRRNTQEISWDDVNAPAYSDFIDKDILLTNLAVEANWVRAYEVINTVNNILLNINNVADATAKNRIQGECLAIRGILYFEMVRLWGPQYQASTLNTPVVPLFTEPINEIGEITTPTLATVEAIYTQSETDLIQASSLLQPFGKNGVSMSYYACEAYLMRMALQKNEFSEAEDHANNIIYSGSYSLMNSPLLAFNNNSNSAEDILAVQQTNANTTGDKSTESGLANYFSSLTESGLGVMRIIGFSLYSGFVNNGPQYSDIDVRGMIDTNVDETTKPTQITTAFYTNVLNNATLSNSKYLSADKVIPIVRLAEIHLSRAEAIFEQNTGTIDNTALSDLNAIRTRAGLPALQVSDFADPFAFYDSLVLERNREFLYEGILFHDLKRWATYLDDVTISSGSDPLDDKFILPIPQSETDTWD